MDYNTAREKLFLPEHGRNIQKMIDYIASIEDDEKRTKYAFNLVNVLYNLSNNDSKDGDFLHKIWDQVYIMSDYKLVVDSPFPAPTPEEIAAKPKRIPYNVNRIKYKHYGNLTQVLINKVAALPDGEKKEKTIAMIATQMKKLYLVWNRESVDDELIFENMQELATEGINIDPKLKLTSTGLLLSQEKNRMLKSTEMEASRNKGKNRRMQLGNDRKARLKR